ENGGVEMDDDRIGRLVLGDVLGDVSAEAAEDPEPGQRDHNGVEIAVPRMIGRKALGRGTVLGQAGRGYAVHRELKLERKGRPSREPTKTAIPSACKRGGRCSRKGCPKTRPHRNTLFGLLRRR